MIIPQFHRHSTYLINMPFRHHFWLHRRYLYCQGFLGLHGLLLLLLHIDTIHGSSNTNCVNPVCLYSSNLSSLSFPAETIAIPLATAATSAAYSSPVKTAKTITVGIQAISVRDNPEDPAISRV
ncbi:hypothetical protein ACH5RR_034085 [Cinchona calisaya]|uniref:Uncharacterized protein n=1 Tax=Cinchona calisaya TaxID=153742 RepID=A0ABD2YDK3_9GENT